MTNKLFIVKYVLFDVDFDKEINEEIIDALFDNLRTNFDKRESFDDIINFDFIFAQNICFFDVAKSVANKINLIKVDKIISIKIFDEINDEVNDEVINDFENICENIFDVVNKSNSININFANFVANFF